MDFNPTDALDDQTARAIIRDIVHSGTIIWSRHAKERMAERGYTTSDVIYILLHGQIIKKEIDPIHNNWSYTFTGDDLDGDEGSVVTAILRRTLGIVITVLA
jgi:hypothetical protein